VSSLVFDFSSCLFLVIRGKLPAGIGDLFLKDCEKWEPISRFRTVHPKLGQGFQAGIWTRRFVIKDLRRELHGNEFAYSHAAVGLRGSPP
jgi:hypothetical protein